MDGLSYWTTIFSLKPSTTLMFVASAPAPGLLALISARVTPQPGALLKETVMLRILPVWDICFCCLAGRSKPQFRPLGSWLKNVHVKPIFFMLIWESAPKDMYTLAVVFVSFLINTVFSADAGNATSMNNTSANSAAINPLLIPASLIDFSNCRTNLTDGDCFYKRFLTMDYFIFTKGKEDHGRADRFFESLPVHSRTKANAFQDAVVKDHL